MSPIPLFPAGTLPFQRADGSDTRMWLGPAGLQHADRQERTWRAMLQKQRACDAAWDWRLEVETAAADRSHVVLAACERSRSGRLHGLMNLVRLPRASRLSRGRDLLYVDMLAV